MIIFLGFSVLIPKAETTAVTPTRNILHEHYWIESEIDLTVKSHDSFKVLDKAISSRVPMTENCGKMIYPFNFDLYDKIIDNYRAT